MNQDPPVHKFQDIPYVRTSEMEEPDRSLFEQWMWGQTRPLIDGISPQDAAYSWDYQRWKDARAGKFVLWD